MSNKSIQIKLILHQFYLIKFCLIFLLFFIFNTGIAQVKWNGVWQGVLIKDGQNEKDALVFYLNLRVDGDKINGKSRAELYSSDVYVVQKISGNVKNKTLEFKETVIESKKTNSKTTWCSAQYTCQYIDSMGYIIGKFTSNTCKRHSGKIILYRSKASFSDKKDAVLGHAWRDVFLSEYKNGKKSPEMREKDRNEFVFEPIYFEYDKWDIKAEYFSYLNKMIEVVNGHSDLRILATGHTDADGSIQYNELLSKKRAKSIETYFSQNGLDIKKLKIDFKGEKEPIESNETSFGKQKNRRVDFKFIYD
ncbi:MAG: OmpA family protein [Flavobacteriia bacterium]|nr:OmpA family protein [Flavobacteriia bacterium]